MTKLNKKIPYFSVCEATEKYKASRKLTAAQIISAAKALLANEVHKGIALNGIGAVINYLIVNYANRKNETFICLFLNNKNRLISVEDVFTGTFNAAPVYPRVIAQRCLELNAANVILAHNHPSGDPKPSFGDMEITKQLKETLKLIDVMVIDHIVIGSDRAYSFAAHNKL